MEITQLNFKDKLPELEQIIKDSSFFAFDAEFTGLSSENTITQFDSPAEYYRKTVDHTKGFIIIQFGLTAFRVCKDEPDKFNYRTYNFYVYPRARRQHFRCQGESIRFLSSQNFDFNKLFRDGISCCPQAEADAMREAFAEKKAKREQYCQADKYTDVEVPNEEKELLEEISDSVEKFLLSNEKEKIIGKCNAFQRRLVYQMLKIKFGNTIFASTKALPNGNKKVIVVERCKSDAEAQLALDEKLNQEMDEMEEYIGLTALIKMLSDSKKLIIGHNMFLDVLYTLSQFVGPLPDKLKEYKKYTHKTFPNLLDTKYLGSQEMFKSKINSNILATLHDGLSREPFSLPELVADGPEYAYTLDDPKEHEAGYDSYLTGAAFIAMAMYLKVEPADINEKAPQLKTYINKLFIMRLADICYINLVGKEITPLRDHVFYVTFPDDWKHSNLVNLFQKFGNVYVAWINTTSAYIALHNRENASIVLNMIDRVTGFTIMTMDDFKSGKKPMPISESEAVQVPVQVSVPKRKLSQDAMVNVDTDNEGYVSISSKSSKKKIPKGKKERTKAKANAQKFPTNDNW